MSQDPLIIQSVTGVDVEFQIAGPGSRSFAFIIDWHIRFLLAIAWLLVGWIVAAGGLSMDGLGKAGGGAVAAAFLPPALIYFFYQPVAELLTRGRSPGKRMAGVRIIARNGDVPSIGALLIRNVFRIIDSAPALYIIGLVATMVTTQNVRIGDLAAGTLLVIDHDREGKSLARLEVIGRNPRLDPRTADLVDEVLERWKKLQPTKRRELAVALLLQIGPESERQGLEALSDGALQESLQRVLNADQPR